jgi:class 3 adenylate cyclase
MEAQRALQNEDWGENGPLLVRMALHTAVVEEREDDYVGPQLNRVARLLGSWLWRTGSDDKSYS